MHRGGSHVRAIELRWISGRQGMCPLSHDMSLTGLQRAQISNVGTSNVGGERSNIFFVLCICCDHPFNMLQDCFVFVAYT
jgi:hypothetical protein